MAFKQFSQWTQDHVVQLTVSFVVLGLIIGLSFRYYGKKNPESILGLQTENYSFPSGYTLAIWEWRKPIPETMKETLQSYKKDGINVVYLDVGRFADISETKDPNSRQVKLDEFQKLIQSYIKLANENGIQVQGLAGGPNWAETSHAYLPGLILNNIESYNKLYPNEALSGMQFDIEPYSQKDYKKSKPEYMVRYLDMVKKTVDRVQTGIQTQKLDSQFTLGFAIPGWYDGEPDVYPAISWQGQTRYIFEHMTGEMNRLSHSYVAIMAYRTTVTGKGGIVSLVEKELALASLATPNVGVVIGQEVNKVDPASITYYGKTKNFLKKNITDVVSEVGNNAALKGFAIHEARSYAEMKEK